MLSALWDFCFCSRINGDGPEGAMLADMLAEARVLVATPQVGTATCHGPPGPVLVSVWWHLHCAPSRSVALTSPHAVHPVP